MPTRTVRIDEDLDQRLVALAAKLDRSVNWLMVKAAQAYVAAAREGTPDDTVTLTDEGRQLVDGTGKVVADVQPLLRADGSPPQSGDVLVTRGGRQVYEARPEPKAARAARGARPDPK